METGKEPLPLEDDVFWGAALRSKSGGLSGQDNGDSVLMDFRCGFVAVSDSSDRNPAFSRDFLLLFSDRLRDIPELVSDREMGMGAYRDCRGRVQRASELALQDVLSSKSCTLTGMILVKTGQGLLGMLVHTGDSLLCLYDGRNVRQISRTNFWMAGRTTRLFQIEDVLLTSENRLLFATDGLSCLPPSPGETKEGLIGRLLKDQPVSMAAERLMDICDEQNGLCDDIAVLSLNPSAFVRRDGRLVRGGGCRTSPPDAGFGKGILAQDDWNVPEAPEIRFLLQTT